MSEGQKELIIDRINQVDIHISVIQSNIDAGHLNKDGMPSFEEILQDFILKKQALQEHLDVLSQNDII